MELYVGKKKVDMLENPSDYLLQRNKALKSAGGHTASAYKNSLDNVVKAVTGISNKKDPAYVAAAGQPWVKSLAQDMTTKLASAEIALVDVGTPY